MGKEAVETGGLMSYGASLPAMYHHAATILDKILKGAKPSDLPLSGQPSLSSRSILRRPGRSV
jgi:putative ABC transport system substrate-binding protein